MTKFSMLLAVLLAFLLTAPGLSACPTGSNRAQSRHAERTTSRTVSRSSVRSVGRCGSVGCPCAACPGKPGASPAGSCCPGGVCPPKK